MVSGGPGACRSRGSRDATPNPVSRTSEAPWLTTILPGLMSLWTRPRRWCLPTAGARPARPLERLAARILEHQYGPAIFADELQRPDGPTPFQLVFQFVFM